MAAKTYVQHRRILILETSKQHREETFLTRKWPSKHPNEMFNMMVRMSLNCQKNHLCHEVYFQRSVTAGVTCDGIGWHLPIWLGVQKHSVQLKDREVNRCGGMSENTVSWLLHNLLRQRYRKKCCNIRWCNVVVSIADLFKIVGGVYDQRWRFGCYFKIFMMV